MKDAKAKTGLLLAGIARQVKPSLLFVLLTVWGMAPMTVRAGGYHHYHRGHWGYGWYPSVSFYAGPGPFYAPAYYYPYPGYATYSDNYVQSRPNYAVAGTLLGALTGGLIGDSIHHQGWEGAGIGAAAGLLLGGLAEHQARVRERSYTPPPVSYAPAPRPAPSNAIANAPTVPDAPVAPAAPTISSGTRPMSSANGLFGR